MDLEQELKALTAEIAGMLVEREALQRNLDKLDTRLMNKLNKKRKLDEQLVQVQKIPTGHSGRAKPAKKLDVDGMSSEAAAVLLQALQQAMGKGA